MNDSSKRKKNRSQKWIACPIEEEFLPLNPKDSKVEKKMASSKDRSKYKKTNQKKMEKKQQTEHLSKIAKKELFNGRVLSIAPEGIVVESDEFGQFVCTLRGVLKKEKYRAKNLITVGDLVLFEKISNQEGSIAHIKERKSVLSRQDHLLRRNEQLIAANIDQVLITVSVLEPILKPFLVDRYIIAAYKGNMDPIIIINKMDLLIPGSSEEALFKEFIRIYHSLHIPVICTSLLTNQGIEELKATMKNKTSVFSGQSGVGKSSLINAMTGLSLKTGAIVEKTKKGSHTTTTTHLITLSSGGWCIDTPGIRSFGLWNLEKKDLDHYFPEIQQHSIDCKFLNCTHSHEPGCALYKAMEEGVISPLRLESYQKLFLNLKEQQEAEFD